MAEKATHLHSSPNLINRWKELKWSKCLLSRLTILKERWHSNHNNALLPLNFDLWKRRRVANTNFPPCHNLVASVKKQMILTSGLFPYNTKKSSRLEQGTMWGHEINRTWWQRESNLSNARIDCISIPIQMSSGLFGKQDKKNFFVLLLLFFVSKENRLEELSQRGYEGILENRRGITMYYETQACPFQNNTKVTEIYMSRKMPTTTAHLQHLRWNRGNSTGTQNCPNSASKPVTAWAECSISSNWKKT